MSKSDTNKTTKLDERMKSFGFLSLLCINPEISASTPKLESHPTNLTMI